MTNVPAPPTLPVKYWPGEGFESRALRQFHDAFGHPNRAVPENSKAVNIVHMNTSVVKALLALRFKLIGEEFAEFAGALYGEDIKSLILTTVNSIADSHTTSDMRINPVEVIDALGDMNYVNNGTMIALGIPVDAVMREIHASNMSKLGADGKPIYREDGKIMKGENFTPPNLSVLLEGRMTPNMVKWVENDPAK